MERTSQIARWPCVACGYLVLCDPPGSFEICDVCGWEDDAVQAKHPRMQGGANGRSVAEWQRDLGDPVDSSDAERDPGWRPLRVDEAELPGGELAVLDHSLDFYGRRAPYYWRADANESVTSELKSIADAAWDSRDFEQVTVLLSPAAEQGSLEAQELLGTILVFALEDQHRRRGAEWLRIAVGRGSGLAAHNLGVALGGGDPGMPAGHEEGNAMLEIAVRSGFEKQVANDPDWWRPDKG